MPGLYLPSLVVLVVIFLLLFLFSFILVGLWISALVQVRIGIINLIGMFKKGTAS